MKNYLNVVSISTEVLLLPVLNSVLSWLCLESIVVILSSFAFGDSTGSPPLHGQTVIIVADHFSNIKCCASVLNVCMYIVCMYIYFIDMYYAV